VPSAERETAAKAARPAQQLVLVRPAPQTVRETGRLEQAVGRATLLAPEPPEAAARDMSEYTVLSQPKQRSSLLQAHGLSLQYFGVV